MRESEEYLESNKHHHYTEGWIVFDNDAEHAVKLAYKEGYLEARAEILELLRQEEGILMISAIVAIREMKPNIEE